MSRYCGTDNSEPILRAATDWRTRALTGAGSIFSAEPLWTTPNIDSLRRHFVDAEDEGEGSFLDKLKLQIAPAEPQVKRLASEMLWFLFLCPNNINPETKKEQIRTVWEWSGRPLPENEALSTPVLEGVGSGGPAFHVFRWKELAFLIGTMLALRAMDDRDREGLLAEGSALSEWLAKQPEGEARQLRHMLLYLLFPDQFERIFSVSDKRAVIQAFKELSPEEVQKIEVARVDEELFKIRTELENRYKTKELDFYTPPLVTQWGSSSSFAISTKDIERDHILGAINEIDRDGVPADARSTTYDLIHRAKRYPPKYVLSLAAKYASGAVYDRELFSGGEKSQAFTLLRAKGFAIERKDFTVNLLKKFLQQADGSDDLSTRDYPKSYRGLRVSVSFGKGNLARIPWISFLGPDQGTANGIYPVYLYYREAGLLILAYGISETSKAAKSWNLPAETGTVQERLVEAGSKAERYGDSYVFSSYPASQLDPVQITTDLDRLVEQYLAQLSLDQENARDQPDVAVIEAAPLEPAPQPFTLEDATKDLFVEPEQFKKIIDLWARKKNLILSGPPGVGKTFFSRRLAYALFKERAPERVGAVQFHQSYSYEDFVQGYRPSRDGFTRKNGLFYDFCERARDDNGRMYVFIIDEINRGNVSKIFGELLMLVESDKRSSEWQIPLAYSQTQEETFHVPDNVYIVGLMNSADRSLAVVDYALRRRFAFVQLTPAYGSARFRSFLKDRGASSSLIEELLDNMGALNEFISKDTANLGPGFAIGHSFFCDVPKEGVPDREWYETVIDTEIAPLLDEYWFDKPDEVRKWVGAYILLLCIAWDNGRHGYLPDDDEKLRRWGRFSREQWTQSRDIILSKFPIVEPGWRANPRMIQEANKQREYSEVQRRKGLMGGRGRKKLGQSSGVGPESSSFPNLSPEKPSVSVSESVSEDKEEAMPPVSTTPLALRSKTPGASTFRYPDWLDASAIAGYEDMRRRLKSPMTDGARRRLVGALERLREDGQDVVAVLNRSEDNCWKGVYPVPPDFTPKRARHQTGKFERKREAAIEEATREQLEKKDK